MNGNRQSDELLAVLTALCDDLAWGRQTDVERLYALTRADAGPARLVRLAEAFGMMLVRVESREFQSAGLIEELKARNAQLEEAKRLLAERNIDLEQAVREVYNPDGQGVVGQCPAMRVVLNLAMSIARRPINTLILGPTGTGKEVFARLIHFNSPRRDGPFVAVNCTAIPDTLFESAMFGIEKGVATGVGARKGLIEEASGGTLFLDELADMSLPNQAKLLRVLEEREVMRVGSAKSVPVDINLISATNVRLENAVREGRFREDLYYRVNVAEIRLPPLRERGDDILLLARFFLERHCAAMKRSRVNLSLAAQELLLRYPWPGNVRELNNEMERLAALTPGDVAELAHLSPRLLAAENLSAVSAPAPAAELLPPAHAGEDTAGASLEGEAGGAGELNLQAAEQRLIQKALELTAGKRSQAAALLGITREGLRKKLLRFEGGQQ